MKKLSVKEFNEEFEKLDKFCKLIYDPNSGEKIDQDRLVLLYNFTNECELNKNIYRHPVDLGEGFSVNNIKFSFDSGQIESNLIPAPTIEQIKERQNGCDPKSGELSGLANMAVHLCRTSDLAGTYKLRKAQFSSPGFVFDGTINVSKANSGGLSGMIATPSREIPQPSTQHLISTLMDLNAVPKCVRDEVKRYLTEEACDRIDSNLEINDLDGVTCNITTLSKSTDCEQKVLTEEEVNEIITKMDEELEEEVLKMETQLEIMAEFEEKIRKLKEE